MTDARVNPQKFFGQRDRCGVRLDPPLDGSTSHLRHPFKSRCCFGQLTYTGPNLLPTESGWRLRLEGSPPPSQDQRRKPPAIHHKAKAVRARSKSPDSRPCNVSVVDASSGYFTSAHKPSTATSPREREPNATCRSARSSMCSAGFVSASEHKTLATQITVPRKVVVQYCTPRSLAILYHSKSARIMFGVTYEHQRSRSVHM